MYRGKNGLTSYVLLLFFDPLHGLASKASKPLIAYIPVAVVFTGLDGNFP